MILSITGFMGCGKSSVGRKLSQLLCCPFMDLDEMIEDEAGKSIPEIFAEVGESGFRQMELTVLSSVLSVKTEEGEDRATRGTKAGGPQAKRSGGVSEANVRTSSVEQTETEEETTTILQIISLGGGTIMTRECAEIVRERTMCVYLRATVETLAEHLEGETQGRPMLSGNVHERISELMAQRAARYESTAHVIIDIDGMSVDEVTHAIIDSLSRR
jgi:shikimate kinase